MCQMFIVSLTIWCISSITFHLDAFFSAYISELLHKLIIWSRSFAAQALSRTDNKTYKIDYRLKTLSLSQNLVPDKTSAATLSFALGPHPTTRFTATEASVLVLKMILSSAQILPLSSKAQRSYLALHFLLLSSALTVSLLDSWLTLAALSLSYNLWDLLHPAISRGVSQYYANPPHQAQAPVA